MGSGGFTMAVVDFTGYIHKCMYTVHCEIALDLDVSTKIDELLNKIVDLYSKYLQEGMDLRTVTKLIFTGELTKHAISEG